MRRAALRTHSEERVALCQQQGLSKGKKGKKEKKQMEIYSKRAANSCDFQQCLPPGTTVALAGNWNWVRRLLIGDLGLALFPL